ncbi:uncharacterized protein MELLADRAFT_114706 [Melampsora larici-populina 98AG31]|uniref:CCHC-type domain-containing protein n=1 Tax=Melampsora larici-populina (strain 98AG31 / pathotype 3-4-7) TaxID=747676 RepID=F4SEG4_MELLP|nr:uncharacterized protein MELLADRAFT_114706 [Melampsora larici-populina 98AG31]EGF96962.1 hypothetical protein MELLADRAFT_114706 [Melampsora larici-populina 98AG31]
MIGSQSKRAMNPELLVHSCLFYVLRILQNTQKSIAGSSSPYIAPFFIRKKRYPVVYNKQIFKQTFEKMSQSASTSGPLLVPITLNEDKVTRLLEELPAPENQEPALAGLGWTTPQIVGFTLNETVYYHTLQKNKEKSLFKLHPVVQKLLGVNERGLTPEDLETPSKSCPPNPPIDPVTCPAEVSYFMPDTPFVMKPSSTMKFITYAPKKPATDQTTPEKGKAKENPSTNETVKPAARYYRSEEPPTSPVSNAKIDDVDTVMKNNDVKPEVFNPFTDPATLAAFFKWQASLEVDKGKIISDVAKISLNQATSGDEPRASASPFESNQGGFPTERDSTKTIKSLMIRKFPKFDGTSPTDANIWLQNLAKHILTRNSIAERFENFSFRSGEKVMDAFGRFQLIQTDAAQISYPYDEGTMFMRKLPPQIRKFVQQEVDREARNGVTMSFPKLILCANAQDVLLRPNGASVNSVSQDHAARSKGNNKRKASEVAMKKNDRTCYNCGKKGHIFGTIENRECPEPASSRTLNYFKKVKGNPKASGSGESKA